MTEYRVVYNGFTFRVQGRTKCGFWFMRWWSSWSDLTSFTSFPLPRQFVSYDEAQRKVDELLKRDSQEEAPWRPVTEMPRNVK